MQQGLQTAPEDIKAANRENRDNCHRTLCFLSIAAAVLVTIVLDIAIPERRSSSISNYFTEMLIQFVIIYLISLVPFTGVRLIRGRSVPTAGLGTGIAAVLLISGIGVYGEFSKGARPHSASHVEDVGSAQR